MAKMKSVVAGQVTRGDVLKLRGQARLYANQDRVYAGKWPRRRGKTKSHLQQAWINHFICAAQATKSPDPVTLDAANYWAKNVRIASAGDVSPSGWYYRDVLSRAMVGKLISYQAEVRITTPTVKATRTTTQSVSAGVETVLVPTAIEWDNNVFWNPTVNPERLTIRAPGLYLVGVTLERTAGGTSRQFVVVRKNGTTSVALSMFPVATAPAWGYVGCIDYFHALDYIDVRVYLTTGASTWKIVDFWLMAITPEQVVV